MLNEEEELKQVHQEEKNKDAMPESNEHDDDMDDIEREFRKLSKIGEKTATTEHAFPGAGHSER